MALCYKDLSQELYGNLSIMFMQQQINIHAKKRGFHLIDIEVYAQLPQIAHLELLGLML